MLTDTHSAPAVPALSRLRPAWRSLALLAGLTVLGLGLRLFRLDYAGYWHDEVISIFAARASAGEIYRSITASDTHPPLYHILLHFWGRLFGYDLIAARLFSVVLSTLCIPFTWLLGRALAGPGAGLLAAALMALAPFQIFHGQQARMYPLLTLVTLLALLSFWHAWERGAVWRWALFALATAAGFYTHVYFSFSALGLGLWAIYVSARQRRIDRRAWTGLILATFAAVLLFVPFLPAMLTLTGGVVSNFWIRANTPLDWLFALVAILNNATALDGRAPYWVLLCLYAAAAGALALAASIGLRGCRRADPAWRGWSLLLFAILTPCLTATLLSLTVRPILLDRSLIGVSGPLFVLLGWAAVHTWARPLTRITAVATLTSVLVGLALTYPVTPRPHSLQPLIETIFRERQPGDAVILLDWQSFDLTALLYPEAPDVYVGSSEADIAYWQRRMAFMGWHTPDQIGPPAAYAGRYRRVWVLGTLYTYPETWNAVTSWLDDHGRVVEEREMAAGEGGWLLVYGMTP